MEFTSMPQFEPGLGVAGSFQLSTLKLGSPITVDYSTAGVPGTQLSATESTALDFSEIMDNPIGVPGIVLNCGYRLVDGSTGDLVEYGATVSESRPDMGFGITSASTRWLLRLLVPPVAGAPYVNVHVYITYLPFITSDDAFA
jgi:hypothetical protein